MPYSQIKDGRALEYHLAHPDDPDKYIISCILSDAQSHLHDSASVTSADLGDEAWRNYARAWYVLNVAMNSVYDGEPVVLNQEDMEACALSVFERS